MNEKARKKATNPYETAGLFSKLFGFYISPFLKLGKSRAIQEDDLPSPVSDEYSQVLTSELEREWNHQVKEGNNPSLLKALFKIYWFRFFYLTLVLAFEEFLRVCQPIFITNLLKYFENRCELNEALINAALLCACIHTNNTVIHPHYLSLTRIGLKIRVSLAGLIYKKSMRLNLSSMDQQSCGHVINLLSNDCTRVDSSVYLLSYLVVAPLEVALVIFLLIYLIDYSVLSGLIVILAVVPTQALLGKLFDHLRRITSNKSDRRINLLSEIFNGIKVIKMYCWEEPFQKLITKLRQREMAYQRNINIVQAFNSTIGFLFTSSITLISVTFLVFFTKLPILPSYIVVAMSNYMRVSSCVGFYFIQAVTNSIGANVSLNRIQSFLLKEEITRKNTLDLNEQPVVKTNKLCAVWPQSRVDFSLKDITLTVNSGEMLAIIGPVGAGKSALLLSILEEMIIISGDLTVRGKVFYVPQEPFIFPASIRQNILFGQAYDKEKLRTVLKACCLDQEVNALRDKDLTIVGDKGINLSGGQRARINMARALYSDAQVFLFDDPLSAVDVKVAKSIYQNCLDRYLRNKIRILVTHQVYLLERVSTIMYMSDGEIKYQGCYEDLILNPDVNIEKLGQTSPVGEDEEAFSRIGSSRSMMSCVSTKTYMSKCCEKDLIKTHDNLADNVSADIDIVDENKEKASSEGLINLKIYFDYFRVGGGIVGAITIILAFVASQFMVIACDNWVSYWASLENNALNSNFFSYNMTRSAKAEQKTSKQYFEFSDRKHFYWIYLGLNVLAIIFACFRTVLYFILTVRSSKNLHKQIFSRLMSTPCRFFDTNPVGRIMNRFSKDMGVVDEIIPMNLLNYLTVLIGVIGSLGVSVWSNFLIIVPLVPILLLMLVVRKYFLSTSVDLKRLEGINKSPILMHVNNTFNGITTLRAANMQEKMAQEFFAHTDFHTSAASTFLFVNRWFAIRLDWLVTIYIYLAVFSSLFLKDFLHANAGQMGIMLVYLISLTTTFQWCIRLSCEADNMMTSVERVLEYTKLPLESDQSKSNKKRSALASDWPNKGEISFVNVTFSYDKSLSAALTDLTFTIKPEEKIGIVGRTGAGKSSLIQALFRMGNIDKGSILIDNIDIADVDLYELRQRLSIIPQDPILFSGTIRSNLDPSSIYDDQTLWDALEKVQLKSVINSMNMGLESSVETVGSNLSAGQRQLICLARAIIKKSKIVCIDEATSSVDARTDQLVQDAIRECFKSCTVLTIAHRLNTIVDSDRIMALQGGTIDKFLSPRGLIETKDNVFYSLLSGLDKHVRESLVQTIQSKQIKNEPSNDQDE